MKTIIVCMYLSWEYVPRGFLLSLYDIWQYSVGKYHIAMLTNGGCYADSARDALATEAIKHNPDYLLWLDVDQTYPGNFPEILMKHIDDGKAIIGGVSPLKKPSNPELDGKPSIWEIDAETDLCRHREIMLNQGVIKVDGMGLGGIMMNPGVFKQMEHPWFRIAWNPKTNHRPAVDLQFYGNCKRSGIDVWCDTNLIYGHLATRQIPLKAERHKIIF
jgi:hypothetical protein